MIAGVVLLAGGVGITMASEHTVWYGAIVVGVYYIGRGAYILLRSPPPPPPPLPPA
ncbi:MAG TPA: hypothetical protein PLR99_03225 [Polyangiaceae bacterium]|nr:hypothetical protein [Polyangiaceae bacterium]